MVLGLRGSGHDNAAVSWGIAAHAIVSRTRVQVR